MNRCVPPRMRTNLTQALRDARIPLRRRIRRRDSTGVGLGVWDWGSGRRWRHCAVASGDETALAWAWAFVIGAAGGGGASERNGGAAAVAPHMPWLPLSPLLALDACCPPPASPPRLHHQLRRRIRRRDSTGVGLGVCDWGSGRRWRHCAIASGDETALAWAWAFVIGAAGGGGATLDACCPPPASPPRLHHQLRRCIRRRDSTGVGLGVCDWGSGRRWRHCAIASGDETALAWGWVFGISAAGSGVASDETALAWGWVFGISAAGSGVVGERNGGAAALRHRIRRRDSTGVGLGVCDWGSGRRWRHCAVASGDETALAWGWVFGISAAGSGVVGERNGGAAAVAPHMPWLPSSPTLTLDACCPPPASPPRLHHQLRRRIRRRDSTGVGLGV
eukprot:XP_001693581.1 predicted protein [Chlamydomonas reinhardtii]